MKWPIAENLKYIALDSPPKPSEIKIQTGLRAPICSQNI